MQIPFITTNVYEGNYPINFYYQQEGYLGKPAYLGTPGLTEWLDLSDNREVRGELPLNDSYAYVVCGNSVYRVSAGGVKDDVTGTLTTSSGRVQMATDGVDNVMIVDGVNGYYTSGTTLTEITDVDFPTPVSVTWQDGWFVVVESGTGTLYNCENVNDPSGWNPLDFSSAERNPDNSVRIITDHRELLVFGTASIEPYQNIGAANFPFAPVPSGYIELGIAAKESAAKLDNLVFFLASDFTIRKLQNYTPVIATPESLSRKIAGYTTKTDAIAYSFYYGSNGFYVLTFPSENVTWVLNAATISQGLPTGAWHQWSSGLTKGRHRSNCHMFFAGKNLVGDYANGKIYEIDFGTYTDDGETIRRERITPQLFDPAGRNSLSYPRLEVEFKAGTGLITGQGSDPKAMLRYSDDGCRTWSNTKIKSVGKIGAYKDRSIWRQLGSSRHRNFELTVTDPVEWVITGAHSPVVVNK